MRSILPFDDINRLTADIRERFKRKEKIDIEDILDEMLDLFLLTYANANRVTGEDLQYEYEPQIAEVMETVNEVIAGKTWTQRTEEYLDEYASAEGSGQTGSTEISQSANAAIGNGVTRTGSGRTESTAPPVYTGRIFESNVTTLRSEEFPESNRSEKAKGSKTVDPGQRIADDLVRIIETESHRIANESALKTAGKAGATKKKWVTMLDEKVRSNHQFLEGQSVPYDADFYTPDGDHARAPGLFALPENNINCRCELKFEK